MSDSKAAPAALVLAVLAAAAIPVAVAAAWFSSEIALLQSLEVEPCLVTGDADDLGRLAN